MCSLRDAAEELESLSVDVFGLSLDDVSALAAFAEAQELPFGLLSDPDGSAARKLRALSGKARYAKRITFVIDDQGVLRDIDTEVQVRSHGVDIAERVSELQQQQQQ